MISMMVIGGTMTLVVTAIPIPLALTIIIGRDGRKTGGN
jgi:hypothetical protein